MNSCGRLLSALQVEEIYRGRARKAGGRQAIKDGRRGETPAARVERVRRAQRGSRDSKLLGCRAVVRCGWCCVDGLAVVRGRLARSSRVGLTLVVVVG